MAASEYPRKKLPESPIKIEAGGKTFKVHLDDRVKTGNTDGNGRLLIDMIPPDDYLLEIASAKMFVTAMVWSVLSNPAEAVAALNAPAPREFVLFTL